MRPERLARSEQRGRRKQMETRMRSGLILALASSRLALPGGFLRRGLFLGFQADAQRAHQVDDVAGRCPLRRGNGLPHLLFRE